jgi:hypothetical protein
MRGEGETEMSLVPEQSLNNGKPNAPFSKDLKAFGDEEMLGWCEKTCGGDKVVGGRGYGRVTGRF